MGRRTQGGRGGGGDRERSESLPRLREKEREEEEEEKVEKGREQPPTARYRRGNTDANR